jgi:hypothetical protein
MKKSTKQSRMTKRRKDRQAAVRERHALVERALEAAPFSSTREGMERKSNAELRHIIKNSRWTERRWPAWGPSIDDGQLGQLAVIAALSLGGLGGRR